MRSAFLAASVWLLSLAPALAQQAAPTDPAPIIATTTPAIMPAAAPSPVSSLAIPLPPGAKVQMEIDASDDDLLGVVKSLLKGFNGQTLLPPVKGKSDAKPGGRFSAMLNDANLADVFKDVTRIHFVLVEMPPVKTALVAPKPGKAGAAKTLLPDPEPDQTAFYEGTYRAEGGHRIVFSNSEDTHFLMVSFGHARGFALVIQSPGTLAVARADGYPNLEKLTALGMTLANSLGSDSSDDSTSDNPPKNSPPKK